MGLPEAIKYNAVEIITGCMFSGKTEELIRRINLAGHEGKNTVLFKPVADTRYHDQNIVSHSGHQREGFAINNSKDILKHIKNHQVIGIDEAQFLDNGILEVCHFLASQNCQIILAGLDKDFNGNPFGSMHDLISISENVTQLAAICHQCGEKAFYTFKKIRSETLIEIGENDIYEARCQNCYLTGMALL